MQLGIFQICIFTVSIFSFFQVIYIFLDILQNLKMFHIAQPAPRCYTKTVEILINLFYKIYFSWKLYKSCYLGDRRESLGLLNEHKPRDGCRTAVMIDANAPQENDVTAWEQNSSKFQKKFSQRTITLLTLYAQQSASQNVVLSCKRQTKDEIIKYTKV